MPDSPAHPEGDLETGERTGNPACTRVPPAGAAGRKGSAVVQMAGRDAPGGDLPQHRLFGPAAIHREGASRMEVTARRRGQRRRYLALHRLEAAVARVDRKSTRLNSSH